MLGVPRGGPHFYNSVYSSKLFTTLPVWPNIGRLRSNEFTPCKNHFIQARKWGYVEACLHEIRVYLLDEEPFLACFKDTSGRSQFLKGNESEAANTKVYTVQRNAFVLFIIIFEVQISCAIPIWNHSILDKATHSSTPPWHTPLFINKWSFLSFLCSK